MAVLFALHIFLVNATAQTTGTDGDNQHLLFRSERPGQVTLRPFCPAPGEQGALPASAAYALCHALSIQRNLQLGTVGEPAYSASWLFNALKKGQQCDTGLRLGDALNWLRDRGVCTVKRFPNLRYSCLPVPDEQKLPAGALHRIQAYHRVFQSNDSIARKIEAVRSCLGDGFYPRPVVVVLAVNLGFDALACASGQWLLAPLAPAMPVQYEAFVVTGYDDAAQTVELLGSYGSHWGNGGFANMHYTDFGKTAHCGIILIPGRFSR